MALKYDKFKSSSERVIIIKLENFNEYTEARLDTKSMNSFGIYIHKHISHGEIQADHLFVLSGIYVSLFFNNKHVFIFNCILLKKNN